MLTSIRVGNFKAFAEPQRIPLRPLTLIYGANSSGKSSILHSLILARHAQETGNLDIHRTNVGGESVDLGGFRQFIHRHNSDLKVLLEWEVTSQSFSKRLAELLPGIKTATIGISIGLSGLDKSLIDTVGDLTPKQIVEFRIEEASEKNDQIELERLKGVLASAEDKLTIEEVARLKSQLRVESCWLDIDSNKFMSTSIRPAGHLQVDMLAREHAATRFLIENLVTANSTSDHIDTEEIDALGSPIDELIPRISFQVGRLFPLGLIDKGEAISSSRVVSFVTVKKETRFEDLRKVIELHLPLILDEILVGISGVVSNELSKLTYLGPLRTYPPRHVGFTEAHDPNWVPGGGAAWDIARRDSAIRQSVNEWLGDEKKLSTPYELRLKYLLTIESLRPKFMDLALRVASKIYPAEMDEEEADRDLFGEVEAAVNEIPQSLEKLESLLSDVQELILFDKRTRTPVSHRDVGIGISQVLPVLVTCLASSDKILAMEQPEIHLHPALQAELGDVFIESALGERKNTLLIETHSEHLILRILRRVRDTSEGELPQEFRPIKPEDIAVLYVSPGKDGCKVVEIPIKPDGEFAEAWPNGFFPERAKELF